MYFLGYETCEKGYRLYNLSFGKIIISRVVIFNENVCWDWNTSIEKTNSVSMIETTNAVQREEESSLVQEEDHNFMQMSLTSSIDEG